MLPDSLEIDWRHRVLPSLQTSSVAPKQRERPVRFLETPADAYDYDLYSSAATASSTSLRNHRCAWETGLAPRIQLHWCAVTGPGQLGDAKTREPAAEHTRYMSRQQDNQIRHLKEYVGCVALSRITKQGHLARLQSGRSTGHIHTDQGRRYINERDSRLN